MANAIYVSDLAQQYFPRSTVRSAMWQLRRWIKLNNELSARLEELHYKPRQRALTPLLRYYSSCCFGGTHCC